MEQRYNRKKREMWERNKERKKERREGGWGQRTD